MIDHDQLHNDIMTRVRWIYRMKRAARPMLEVLCLVLLGAAANSLVYWQAAVNNMTSRGSVFEWLSYALDAFIYTELSVQLVLVSVLTVVLLFVWDVLMRWGVLWRLLRRA